MFLKVYHFLMVRAYLWTNNSSPCWTIMAFNWEISSTCSKLCPLQLQPLCKVWSLTCQDSPLTISTLDLCHSLIFWFFDFYFVAFKGLKELESQHTVTYLLNQVQSAVLHIVTMGNVFSSLRCNLILHPEKPACSGYKVKLQRELSVEKLGKLVSNGRLQLHSFFSRLLSSIYKWSCFLWNKDFYLSFLVSARLLYTARTYCVGWL